jgi:hypothetical protein
VLPITVFVLSDGRKVAPRAALGEMTHRTPPAIGVERSDYPGQRPMAGAHAGHGHVANPFAVLGRLVSRILAPRQ